ncbi:MAG: response regulator [Candidatus Aminicenantes bacterium]|nr:response regulator [Candidatus Aminicenantes bacterium]
MIALILHGLFFVTSQPIFGRDAGSKYFKNYTHEDYGAHNQNWSITQDNRGIIYVGNTSCLLEYDGVSWRSINIPNKTVRSMAVTNDGIIYIGGYNEIGYLSPDAKGTLTYVSLCRHLAEKHKNFSRVWRTHATKEGVYFRASKFLFRWRPGSRQMDVWQPEDDSFYSSFTCDGELYVGEGKTGLRKMTGDSIRTVPGGEIFAKKAIAMIVPYDEQKLLIGTRSAGFYIFDGKTMTPFATEADAFLEANELYQGIRLSASKGDFALATRRGGLVIIDSRGKLKDRFTGESGLQNDNVKYVFEDYRGNLWLALSKGTAKIEYASPLSTYDQRSGLPGAVRAVVKHQNILYAGTEAGLYYLSASGQFFPVRSIIGECWGIISIGDYLLAATNEGVSQVDTQNNNLEKVIEDQSFVLLQSRVFPGRIWAGTHTGLVALSSKHEEGRWVEESRIENTRYEIRTIVEDEKGNLWLGTLTQGILKVDFRSPGDIHDPMVRAYDFPHGLPRGEVHVCRAAGHVMFAAAKNGIYRFDERREVFIPDSTLGDEFSGGSRGVFRVVEDKNNNIWFHSLSKNFQAFPQADGSYAVNPSPVCRIPSSQVNAIYSEPDGNTTWFAGHAGLIRYDGRVKSKPGQDFSSLVRKVLVNGKLYFDGYTKSNRIGTADKSKKRIPVIDYENRNIRFEFAAPSFAGESLTRYRCFLEGYDKDWSAFTPETRKDYTNLDSREYRFRVQAKNAYGMVSKEATFQFRVLPPWTKTWWAVLLYVLTGLIFIFLVVKWRSAKLEREKQKLEQVVKLRTKEINDKNRQLKEQSEKLKDMDQVKSRFFANISHEFRTPLTLIMGPMEQMLTKSRGKEQQKQLFVMLRNSQRLLTLINQLLDLSKIDSGKMKLQAAPQDVIPFLKGILFSFESLAAREKLELKFHTGEGHITLYFDTEKIEQVICNLLSNAIKFTPAGGQISLSLKRNPPFVEITVRDSGIGIPNDQLHRIFDRFFRVESPGPNSGNHYYEGTGIGLALTRELVELHQGKIEVHSRKEETGGTEFVVFLPLGKEHLKPSDIVTSSEVPAGRRKIRTIPAPYMVEEEEVENVEADEIEPPGKDSDKELEPRQKSVVLVVDDNADVRHYIRSSLEPHFVVAEAKDGQAGIGKAKEILPDLIVSDVMMPKTDGYELCHILKNDIETSHIPIILLTAKAAEENIIRGLETGADDYITKPFNTKILLTRIRNLIDLRRQLQKKIQRRKMLLPAEISVSSIDESFLKEFQDTLEKNLSDPELNIDQLCKKLYMGRTTLFRKIEALTGQTPNQFIQSYRLERAAQLLKANFGNVTEVAFEVGFSSSAYFTKCFKEKFHQLPSTFQASESSGGPEPCDLVRY